MSKPTEEMDFRYRVYDDDGNLYGRGFCTDLGADMAYDWWQWDCGTTLLKLYDRKTGKYVDAIG